MHIGLIGGIGPAATVVYYQRLCARMRELEREVTDLNLPNLYMGEMYNLKIHIGMVLRRLEERRMALAARPPSRSAGA